MWRIINIHKGQINFDLYLPIIPRVLVLFFFLLFNNLYSQKTDSSFLEIKYEASILKDSLDPNSLKNEILVLRIGKNSSLFKSDIKIKNDSLNQANIKKITHSNTLGILGNSIRSRGKTSFNQEVFKDQDKTLIYDRVLKNNFAFESINKINWQLIDEQKMIDSFLCKKAETFYGKRRITAWYTTEIPIPEGPYTFKGLPGLVLEAIDSKNHFTFKLLQINKVVKSIEPMNRNVVYTTFDKFLKIRNQYLNNPVSTFQNSSNRVLSQKQQEILKANSAKKNNFLD